MHIGEAKIGSVRHRSDTRSGRGALRRIGITAAAVAALVVPLSLAGTAGRGVGHHTRPGDLWRDG